MPSISPPRNDATRNASEFVQLLREFLAAHAELGEVFGGELHFGTFAAVVGDNEGSVLFRLKQRTHGLFRVADEPAPDANANANANADSNAGRRKPTTTYMNATGRREALFDLAIGSLFHEAMKLRESLYQREVYQPRLASLRAATEDEPDALFDEFEELLGRSGTHLDEIVAEVRILLAQTRDQFRRLLIARAGERGVTRCLLGRRAEVDATFPEGFAGLLESMHGDLATGLIEGAHALLDSAYFEDAAKLLREASRHTPSTHHEIEQLELYADGMQAFLDGAYAIALASLEGWTDLSGHIAEPTLARRAAAAISRVGRLVENDAEGAEIVDGAKQLQLRLESTSP